MHAGGTEAASIGIVIQDFVEYSSRSRDVALHQQGQQSVEGARSTRSSLGVPRIHPSAKPIIEASVDCVDQVRHRDAQFGSVPVEVAAAVPAPPPAVPATQARNDNADISRMRLTIEATPEGRFIYKVLDRVTGEVIRQLPREEVERLNADPTYRGGKVVDTTI